MTLNEQIGAARIVAADGARTAARTSCDSQGLADEKTRQQIENAAAHFAEYGFDVACRRVARPAVRSAKRAAAVVFGVMYFTASAAVALAVAVGAI